MVCGGWRWILRVVVEVEVDIEVVCGGCKAVSFIEERRQ